MYIPHSREETARILSELGLMSLEDLFSHIDPSLLRAPSSLPKPKSEQELREYFGEIASLNRKSVIFAGAGSYDRIIPSVIPYILQRGELLTAYTPYQPEASQGTLQAIFEYQTLIAELTGMEVANASLYDGASALAEGVLMAKGIKGKGSKVILSRAIHPLYRQVVKTYLLGYGDETVEIGFTGRGTTDLNALEDALKGGSVYALCVQYPNFFGYIEPLKDIGELADRYGVLFVVVADPVALAVLKPPGDFGAHIVVGEGQQLGLPLSFGGPYVGFFATLERFVRKMPGRLVGLAEDMEGRRAFTLVLQTREQHIRRERATSNVCTNQSLLAVANLLYLCLLGRDGLKEVASQSISKAFYLKNKLISIGFEEVFGGKHLWEFVLRHENAERMRDVALGKGYLFGIPLKPFYGELENSLLLAVTEKRTKREMDTLVRLLSGL